MRSVWVRVVVLILPILLATGVTCVLEAQPSGTVQEGGKKRVAKSQSPFRFIGEKRKEYDDLESRARRVSAADRRAFEKRSVNLAVEIVGDLQTLARDIAAREKAGEDVTADRGRVT